MIFFSVIHLGEYVFFYSRLKKDKIQVKVRSGKKQSRVITDQWPKRPREVKGTLFEGGGKNTMKYAVYGKCGKNLTCTVLPFHFILLSLNIVGLNLFFSNST